jgi:hypothetical protein
MSMPGTELFTAFEHNLSKWLARAVEPPAEPPPRHTEPALLRMFEERLKLLQTYLDKAEQDAEKALVPLTNDIQAMQKWLDALSTARNKLAECTVRPAAG